MYVDIFHSLLVMPQKQNKKNPKNPPPNNTTTQQQTNKKGTCILKICKYKEHFVYM